MSVLSSAIFIASSLLGIIEATCYNPDGSSIDNPAFQPCNQVVGQFSMCCGTNWTGGVVAPDTCQENGLCLNSYEGIPLYWRGSCNDPTWKSPNCLANLCTSPSDRAAAGSNAIQNVALTECHDGTWCCGRGNNSCCKEAGGDGGTKIADVVGQAVSTSQSSSSVTTSSPSPTTQTTPQTTSGSTSPPTSTNEAQSGGLSDGTKVGLGVGITGCLLALGVLLTCLVCLRRKRQNKRNTDEVQGTSPRVNRLTQLWHRHELPAGQSEKPGPQIWHEVDGGKALVELYAPRHPVELPAEV